MSLLDLSVFWSEYNETILSLTDPDNTGRLGKLLYRKGPTIAVVDGREARPGSGKYVIACRGAEEAQKIQSTLDDLFREYNSILAEKHPESRPAENRLRSICTHGEARLTVSTAAQSRRIGDYQAACHWLQEREKSLRRQQQEALRFKDDARYKALAERLSSFPAIYEALEETRCEGGRYVYRRATGHSYRLTCFSEEAGRRVQVNVAQGVVLVGNGLADQPEIKLTISLPGDRKPRSDSIIGFSGIGLGEGLWLVPPKDFTK